MAMAIRHLFSPEYTLPTKLSRTQSPSVAHDERDLQRSRSSASHLEYARLMTEAKEAFDRITTQNAMTRSVRTARRTADKAK